MSTRRVLQKLTTNNTELLAEGGRYKELYTMHFNR
jgi:hypothetical protein